MYGSTHKLLMGILGVGVLLLGLSAPALGQGAPPPAGPVEDIQATLGIILDRLDELQNDVDNLPGALGPCEVPPVWGQTYATADRFVSVLGGAAFCDKATGLVWEGSPDTNTQASWQSANSHCTRRTVGGVKGFHLPLIEQLTSLLPLTDEDLNSATGDGPFTGVQSAYYSSATTIADGPSSAWNVDFFNGSVDAIVKDNGHRAWCVRGGQAYDG